MLLDTATDTTATTLLPPAAPHSGSAAGTRDAHVWRAVQAAAWAILPEKLATLLEVLALHTQGVRLSPAEIAARVGPVRDTGGTGMGDGGAGRNGGNGGNGRVAVIPVYGTITQRPSVFSSGGTSAAEITAAFRTALADPAIHTILFEVDSPGGTVDGVPELAAEIRAARGTKPIVAVANGLAASAAYWLASAADELVVTPSGAVGSIGIFAVHQDHSKRYADAGIQHTLISAGKYKTEGHPYAPLSPEAHAAAQAQVDAFYGLFTRDVARQRGTTVEAVRSGFGEGRTVLAHDAVTLGMADRVATFDATRVRLQHAAGAPAVPLALAPPEGRSGGGAGGGGGDRLTTRTTRTTHPVAPAPAIHVLWPTLAFDRAVGRAAQCVPPTTPRSL